MRKGCDGCSVGLYAVQGVICCSGGLYAVQAGYMDVQGGHVLFRGAICGK